MNRKQYIAAGISAIALAALIWVVPGLSEQENLLPAGIVGGVSLIVFAACVFLGGLTEIKEDNP